MVFWLYTIVLTLHSIVRWIIILAAALVIIRAINGLAFKRGWTQQDNRFGLWYVISLDVQTLLGLLLYFALSPITLVALRNFGAAMKDASTRYFAIEHILMMLIALAIAHAGRSFIRKAATAKEKHRRTILWYGLSIVLVLAAIPWPFTSVGRPLLHLLSF